jgi:hypothetical protein
MDWLITSNQGNGALEALLEYYILKGAEKAPEPLAVENSRNNYN